MYTDRWILDRRYYDFMERCVKCRTSTRRANKDQHILDPGQAVVGMGFAVEHEKPKPRKVASVVRWDIDSLHPEKGTTKACRGVGPTGCAASAELGFASLVAAQASLCLQVLIRRRSLNM